MFSGTHTRADSCTPNRGSQADHGTRGDERTRVVVQCSGLIERRQFFERVQRSGPDHSRQQLVRD